jgi:hypothetical protein
VCSNRGIHVTSSTFIVSIKTKGFKIIFGTFSVFMINLRLNYFDRSNFEKLRNVRDIDNNGDLHLLVAEFYKKLLSDSAIASNFTNIVTTQLEERLPVLVTF